MAAVTSLKLLWLPGRPFYKLRVFTGPNTHTRQFRGELELPANEAEQLHLVIAAGELALELDVVNETGWIDPAELRT